MTPASNSSSAAMLPTLLQLLFFFFSSRRRHTRFDCDWSSDVCSSDLTRFFAVKVPCHAHHIEQPSADGPIPISDADKRGTSDRTEGVTANDSHGQLE